MLRSSRLTEPGITAYIQRLRPISHQEVLEGLLNLQPGDTMTGWEIIAGLPLEEQASIPCPIHYLDKNNIRSREDFECHEFTDCGECISRWCGALYRWNGESWEVVD